MRLVSIFIIFALPVLDLIVSRQLASAISVSLWVWLLGAAIAGVLVLRNEGQHFRARFMAALTCASAHEPNPWRSVVVSGKKVLAGVLLILPGMGSDFAALALMLVPINIASRVLPVWASSLTRATGLHSGNGRNTITGSYSRVD